MGRRRAPPPAEETPEEVAPRYKLARALSEATGDDELLVSVILPGVESKLS